MIDWHAYWPDCLGCEGFALQASINLEKFERKNLRFPAGSLILKARLLIVRLLDVSCARDTSDLVKAQNIITEVEYILQALESIARSSGE